MQYFEGYQSAQKSLKGAMITIGNFDGLHLGHQALIKETKSMAARREALAAVYTFSPHPARVLSKKSPLLLMTDEQKRRGFEKLGIDAAIFEPFTFEFSRIPAVDFLQSILVDSLGVSGVVVGENFNFGYKGAGDAQFLQEYLSSRDVAVKIMPPVLIDGKVCSSSIIRQFISAGQVDEAAGFLGRYYSLEGVVIHGDGRGKQIGFPSATLQTDQELLPAVGVYATRVKLAKTEKHLLAATNIGYRPTFKDDKKVLIETHILDFDRSIYRQHMELEFVKKIRNEIKFDSVDALKTQIAKDLLHVRQTCTVI